MPLVSARLDCIRKNTTRRKTPGEKHALPNEHSAPPWLRVRPTTTRFGMHSKLRFPKQMNLPIQSAVKISCAEMHWRTTNCLALEASGRKPRLNSFSWAIFTTARKSRTAREDTTGARLSTKSCCYFPKSRSWSVCPLLKCS